MTDDQLSPLVARVARWALAAKIRLVTAESCTGGWIAKVFTDAPGSSRWFECGYVTYSNQAKSRDLGVSPRTLHEHGAVSEAVVREMAAGALRVTGADVSVAVSGIAGPEGGSAEKPVGTVWFCAARRVGRAAEVIRAGAEGRAGEVTGTGAEGIAGEAGGGGVADRAVEVAGGTAGDRAGEAAGGAAANRARTGLAGATGGRAMSVTTGGGYGSTGDLTARAGPAAAVTRSAVAGTPVDVVGTPIDAVGTRAAAARPQPDARGMPGDAGDPDGMRLDAAGAGAGGGGARYDATLATSTASAATGVSSEFELVTEGQLFGGDREAVRRASVKHALELILRFERAHTPRA